jgi:hypothetical protein
MTTISRLLIAGAVLLAPGVSLACSFSGDGCNGNGKECVVYCANGNRAGSMYFNGTVWTDGVKWAPTAQAEARKICDANGSACL